MRIIHSDIKKGDVELQVTNLDDLWHLSQVIISGDIISGKTLRRIVYGDEQTSSEKKPVFIKLHVETLKFHPYADVLRIGGVVLEGSEGVEHGSHHTFNVELQTRLTIHKEEWRKFEIDRLKEAVSSSEKPKVLVCAFELGQADFALLRDFGLHKLGTFTKTIPGKREGFAKAHDSAKNEFYSELLKKLAELSKDIPQVIIGGTGFDAENLRELMGNKYPALAKKSHIVKISDSGINGLHELLKQGVIENIVNGLRVSKETGLVQEVIKRISKEGKIAYGIKEVEHAVELMAAEQVLIIDKLVRKHQELLAKAEKSGSEITIISSENEAGQQLEGLGGIAAFLRYKI